MADLDLTVSATGADRAVAQLDHVAGSVQKTGTAWDTLRRKVGSGEVLRNAAASAALLGMGAGDVTQKVAALGGALASIPGPIGAVAASVAVAATVFGVFSQQAKEAEARIQAFRSSLASLGKEKISAQVALAGQIGGAAAKVGGDLRGFFAGGGSEANRAALARLTPGDPNAALRGANALGESGLSTADQSRVIATAAARRNAGEAVTDTMLAGIIAGVKESAANFAPIGEELTAQIAKAQDDAAKRGGGSFVGGGYAAPSRETGGLAVTDFLDSANVSGPARDRLLDRFNRANRSQTGSQLGGLLSAAEAPALAESNRTVADAMGAGMAQATEALRVAEQLNTTATISLTKAITDLTGKIQTTEAAMGAVGGGKPLPDSAWTDRPEGWRGAW